MLLYHCKSGQDRTGTLYAINQMVITIYLANKKMINSEMSNELTLDNIIKILIKYFDINNVSIKNQLQRHLYMSYIITWASTGIPGIKWSLGSSKPLLGSVENKFAYLVTTDVNNARLFEGYSKYRGS